MNPAKRRRVDANASTLRKPFRSPLKVSIDGRTSHQSSPANNLEQQKPHPSPSLTAISADKSNSRESHPSPSPGTAASAVDRCSTDEITLLQKKYSALTQELRRLRQDLDVAEQAQKLCSSNQGKQLDRLVLKWRDIARSAADQAFDITNDRVRDMGGIRAWQKSTQESAQSWLDYEPSLQGDCQRQNDRDTIDEQSTKTRHAEEETEDDEQQEVSSEVQSKG